MKKKVIIIVLSIITFLFLCVGAGCLIWYVNSPLPTALSLAQAIMAKDIISALGYIEPDTAQKIRLLMNITGMSSEDIIEMLSEWHDSSDSLENKQEKKIKLDDYIRNGDFALVVLLVDESSITLNFVKIEEKWYLCFSTHSVNFDK